MNLHGSIVALITPFTKNNEVDYKALKNLIIWHLEQQSNGIVILGTTGESPTLSEEEKTKIIDLTCQVVQKKIPVVVGTGSNCTATTIKNTIIAKKYGADGCLVVAPYYNKPTQDGLFVHYTKVADVGLPTIIYHHPKRTGVSINIETLLKLQSHSNIFAVKDSTGDLAWMQKIIQDTSLKLFSGNDENTFDIMCQNASGSISVIANLIPNSWSLMHKLLLDKKIEKAKLIYNRFSLLLKALLLEVNPQCVKYALSLIREDCLGELRLPLLKPKVETQLKIREAFAYTSSVGSVASKLV